MMQNYRVSAMVMSVWVPEDPGYISIIISYKKEKTFQRETFIRGSLQQL